MKLLEKVWQSGNDWDGVLECEFCNTHQTCCDGYDDDNFYLNVIPAIQCVKCGKRTDENLRISDPGTRGGKSLKKAFIQVERWGLE